MAKKAKTVFGIEVNQKAHQDAVFNKNLNSIRNVKFFCDDVEHFIKSFKLNVDILFLDPTRDGATPSFLSSVIKLKPKKIVYISCNPKTQVRDLRYLINYYSIDYVEPVDMFSQTAHVENIVLLSLKTA